MEQGNGALPIGIPIGNYLAKKEVGGGGGGGGGFGLRSYQTRDSEGSGSLIGGTSFPLVTFLWLQQELAFLLTFT